MPSLLDDLNPPQREAVTHGTGPLLVLAGAGSGKTRVLTYRIAHLLGDGLAAPHEITAVTFTNRAAGEMVERVERLLGRPPGATFVGTFHRWALTLLRAYPERLGLPRRFAILDSDDQRSLVARAVKDLDLDPKVFPAREVQARISAAAAQARYEEGASAYLDALQARRDALGADLAAAEAVAGQRVAMVGLLKALAVPVPAGAA